LVVDPLFPWPATTPAYLEVITSVKFPVVAGLPTTDDVIGCYFQDEDRQHLYVYTISDVFAFRLHYDIYTIDAASWLALTREEYTDICVR
jgi:hypothetical protein